MPLLLDLIWCTQTIVLCYLAVWQGLQLAKCTCHMHSTMLPCVLWRSITSHHTLIAPLRWYRIVGFCFCEIEFTKQCLILINVFSTDITYDADRVLKAINLLTWITHKAGDESFECESSALFFFLFFFSFFNNLPRHPPPPPSPQGLDVQKSNLLIP